MKKFKNLENIGIPQSAYIKKGMVRAVNQKYRMLNLTQPQKVNNNYVQSFLFNEHGNRGST